MHAKHPSLERVRAALHLHHHPPGVRGSRCALAGLDDGLHSGGAKRVPTRRVPRKGQQRLKKRLTRGQETLDFGGSAHGICSGVDAFTYAGNVLVECCKRRPGEHAVPQLIIVFLSLGLLCSFTQDALQESWRTVHVCRGKAEEEEQDADVNGWITLAFGAFGVAFDVTCMLEFRKSHKRQGRSVNMFSAILHVGADFLRSTSTLVMSFIILSSKVDSNCVDAYTSIVIGATIIAGALVGFWKWLRLLFRLCFGWGSKEATAASVA